MTELLNALAEDGIQFFGRICASVSHELKNSLSIMNESAGLLEDLSVLAEKGRPIDLVRVKALSGQIRRQIQRTDQIIRNMNRFSHSVDDPFRQVSLHDSLNLVLAVTRRLTETRGISINLSLPPGPVSVITRPFYLHHLIWRVIEFGMGLTGPSKVMALDIRPETAGVEIRFSGLEGLLDGTADTAGPGREFPGRTENLLLSLLGARIKLDIQLCRAGLWMPGQLPEQNTVQ